MCAAHGEGGKDASLSKWLLFEEMQSEVRNIRI